jgi:GntR family transcriptional regulator, rspAB operon transcriptional repressor
MVNLPAIVQPLPLTRLAYDRLRESILSGQMTPGEIYNEMALAKELGVSRTPVREALLELSSQGLVTFLPRKGVQVNYFTQQDVEEVYEIRNAVELAIVEKLARNPAAYDFSIVEQALAENARAAEMHDAAAFLIADRTLHSELAILSGNRRMLAISSNLRDIIHLMSVEALTKPHRLEDVPVEHARVVEAIRRGDVEGAIDAMRHHMEQSKVAVLERHRTPEPVAAPATTAATALSPSQSTPL